MERLRGNMPIFLIWLAVCGVLVLVTSGQIMTGIGWDPDDQLRMVQLRDWLSGQSWFDTTQYRIGEPDSQPMHWPRWIELPLALVYMLLKPLIGVSAAETGAMIMVPLISLGIAMLLIAKITEQVFDRKIAILAAALTTTAVPIVAQIRPMRVDHHGWQIVLALAALWTMFCPDRRKGGIALGATLAFWLSISGSFDSAINYCDALSPAHLWACTAAAVIILPAIKFLAPNIILRIGGLAIAAAVALAVLHGSAPQCIGGAFNTIDPLVRQYWLVNILEGLPIWYQNWKTMVNLLGGSIIVGLASLIYIIRSQPGQIDHKKLFVLGYAFIWALLLSIFVQRATAVAAAFGLPFMAWAVHRAFLAARRINRPVSRILATASVVFLIMPGPLAMALFDRIAGDKQQTEEPSAATACNGDASLAGLNSLPRSNLVAPFDFGPRILLLTPHSVLATSHHRNDKAMADQIRIFTSRPEVARRILNAHDISYIVACEEEAELDIYAREHPAGLWAQLSDGRPPEWLKPVHIRDNNLTLWSVSSKKLRKAM